MRLESLTLVDFRNYAALELEPQPGLNLFVGRNAQGKSNLLEAIAVLGVGRSFRGGRDADLIRAGTERASVRAVLSDEGSAVGCVIARHSRGTRKTFNRARRNVPFAGFVGALRVVTFVPSDVGLANSATMRRRFLNTALVQQNPAYYRSLARYEGALRQKNAILRDVAPDPQLVAVYNETLAESGAALMAARSAFVDALASEANAVHWRWSGEELSVRYAPNVSCGANEADIRAALAERFNDLGRTERIRRTTLGGPHRDDLSLALDGRTLSTFGSQGQQRTAVLALKIAEYAVMRERAGTAPLLLLDDVLSELDEDRAAAFLAGVGDYEQAYVTATHRPQRLVDPAGVFTVRAARVERTC